MQNLFKPFQEILYKFEIKTLFNNTRLLHAVYTNTKCKVRKKYKTELIYKIACNNCGATYIRQTKQYLLKKRIPTRLLHEIIKSSNSPNTALAKHGKDKLHT